MNFNQRWERPPSMEEYRKHYPRFGTPTPGANDNLQFYNNLQKSRPRGAMIEDMHQNWAQNYDLLESHHGYIQWLFPLRESSRFNASSQILQPHEMDAMQSSPVIQRRFVQTLKMMLNFWGCQIVDQDGSNQLLVPEKIRVERCDEWSDRLLNTRTHGHNNMRISRMLKCCGELGFEHYKRPIIEFFIHECFGEHAFLSESHCVASCRDYWVETLRDDQERATMKQLISSLESTPWAPSAEASPLCLDERDTGRIISICWNTKSEQFHDARIVQVGQTRQSKDVRHKVVFAKSGATKIYILGGATGKTYRLLSFDVQDSNNDEEQLAADRKEEATCMSGIVAITAERENCCKRDSSSDSKKGDESD